MMEELVKIENLWVTYGELAVLEDINLTIYQNDFLGLIGPNGGGKTTLLKVILGLVEPTKGKITIKGLPPARGRNIIGYVPQHMNFDTKYPIKVLDVVLMGRLRERGLLKNYNSEDLGIALKALETVKMLEFKDRPIGSLSGGQKQRIFIARALVTDLELLILDEPTASIDKQTESSLYELLESVKGKVAIVLVSHDIGVISAHVGRIACLNKKLFVHDTKQLTEEMLEETYQCPVELITHGPIPHRVMHNHPH